jgi:hypothetical protein
MSQLDSPRPLVISRFQYHLLALGALHGAFLLGLFGIAVGSPGAGAWGRAGGFVALLAPPSPVFWLGVSAVVALMTVHAFLQVGAMGRSLWGLRSALRQVEDGDLAARLGVSETDPLRDEACLFDAALGVVDRRVTNVHRCHGAARLALGRLVQALHEVESRGARDAAAVMGVELDRMNAWLQQLRTSEPLPTTAVDTEPPAQAPAPQRQAETAVREHEEEGELVGV